MNLAAVSKTVITLFPYIIDAIKSVEATQGAGNGAYKKTLALGLISAIYSTTNPTIPFTDLAWSVEQIITALVEFYNATKAFIKNPAAVPIAA